MAVRPLRNATRRSTTQPPMSTTTHHTPKRSTPMGNGRQPKLTRAERYDALSLVHLLGRFHYLKKERYRARAEFRLLMKVTDRSPLTESKAMAHLSISIPLMTLAIRDLGQAIDRRREAIKNGTRKN